jgi:hypothetical protein
MQEPDGRVVRVLRVVQVVREAGAIAGGPNRAGPAVTALAGAPPAGAPGKHFAAPIAQTRWTTRGQLRGRDRLLDDA